MSRNDRIYKVFVAGTWSSERAEPFADLAAAVGRGLAQHGFDLITGPGTGISAWAISGFQSIESRGKLRVYLPAAKYMQLVGEELTGEFDEVVQTQYDYPMRNVYHISKSDALVVITGGDGTLEECLPALIDYMLPTIVLKNSGKAAEALSWLSENLFPEWKKILSFVDTAAETLDILTRSLHNTS